MDLTHEDDQDWMARGHAQDAVIADAKEGDTLSLSRYIDQALVLDRIVTGDGVALLVKSPYGSAEYRLRAPDDDDDRLLLEKPDDDTSDGWTPHVRVEAEFTAPDV